MSNVRRSNKKNSKLIRGRRNLVIPLKFKKKYCEILMKDLI